MKKLKIPLLGQRDPRWANILLGFNTQSQYNLGQYGCLITAYCMYVNALGRNETPATVNEQLKAINGFTTSSGNLVWSKVSQAFGLNEQYASPVYNDLVSQQGIDKVKSFIDDGYPLVVHIDFDPRDPDDDQHWLLVIGYDNDIIYANDPWSGTEVSLDVYGGAKRAIIQFKVYDKKVSFVGADQEAIQISKEDFERIRQKSEQYDLTVQYLEAGDPNITMAETLKSIIAGIKSQVTTLQNDIIDLSSKLGQANTEALNQKDKLANIVAQCQREKDLLLAEIKALKESAPDIEKLKGVYMAKIGELEGMLREEQKQGGLKDLEIIKWKSNFDNLSKNQTVSRELAFVYLGLFIRSLTKK